MKKLFITFCSILLFSGCINVMQYIEIQKNDSMNVSMKFTISKSIMEAAKNMGKDTSNLNQENFDLDGKFPESAKAKYTKIDTNYEAGFFCNFYVDKKNQDNLKDIPFSPSFTSKGLSIKFPNINTAEQKEADESSKSAIEALLGSAKFSLIIKDNKGKIKNVNFKTGTNNFKLETQNLSSELLLVEVPVSLWYNAKSDCDLLIDLE